jgi:hypothetical protein
MNNIISHYQDQILSNNNIITQEPYDHTITSNHSNPFKIQTVSNINYLAPNINQPEGRTLINKTIPSVANSSDSDSLSQKRNIYKLDIIKGFMVESTSNIFKDEFDDIFQEMLKKYCKGERKKIKENKANLCGHIEEPHYAKVYCF